MTSDLIRSRANPLLKRLHALKRQAGDDLLLVEGPKLLEEAVDAGVEILEVAASPRLLRQGRGRALAARVEAHAPVRVLDDALLAALSEVETSQGVVAVARRPRFDEAALFSPRALLLVAVGVQDPGNVGALLRAAEGAGASGAVLTAGCADPFSWKALRGSMGSAFRLPHVKLRTAAAAVEKARAASLRLVGAAGRAGTAYDAADLARPLALFVGAEGAGLPPDVQAAMDEQVAIPMASPVESLNVAVAAGVLLFEAARQRRLRGPRDPGYSGS
jgi:RNA methyltransferase, TrmH family